MRGCSCRGELTLGRTFLHTCSCTSPDTCTFLLVCMSLHAWMLLHMCMSLRVHTPLHAHPCLLLTKHTSRSKSLEDSRYQTQPGPGFLTWNLSQIKPLQLP